ncbi:MAG: hypothetical protein Q4Q07_01770 [Tissierellia bacterium]|nr:hypothetical protein [Tissierellia bacterium]
MGKKLLLLAGIIIGLLGIYLFVFYQKPRIEKSHSFEKADPVYEILKDRPEKIKETQYFISKGENSTSQSEMTIKNNHGIIHYPLDDEMSEPQKDITARNAILLFSMYPKLEEIDVTFKNGGTKYHPLTRREAEMYIGRPLDTNIDTIKAFQNLYHELDRINFSNIWIYENEEKLEPTKDIVKAIRQGLKQLYPPRDIGQPEIIALAWHELGRETENGQIKLYLFVHYEGYNFINNDFVSVIGANEYICLALNKKKNGEYSYGYGVRSEQGLRPYDIIPEYLFLDFDVDEYSLKLSIETYEQAKAYVEEMNRDAKVYQASKAPTRKYISPLLHDGGKSFPKGFPLFEGSIEYLIGSTRLIYTTLYDKKENLVTLTISDTQGTVIEKEEFHPGLE